MNTVTAKLVKTVLTQEVTIVSEKGTFICTETYEDKKLTRQTFKTMELVHNGYEPDNMLFAFYGDASVTDIISAFHRGDYDAMPEPVLIENLETFDEFEKLYCMWLHMDGNMYVITEPDPLPSLRRLDIGSKQYDLKKCKELLLKNKNVFDIKIAENCYPNWDICGRQSLHFSFQADREMTKKINKEDCFERDQIIIKHIGLDEFKYSEPNTDYDYYDDEEDDD